MRLRRLLARATSRPRMYRADVEAVDGLSHRWRPSRAIRPPATTGLDRSSIRPWARLPVPLSQDLHTWHRELVIDEYVSITVNGETRHRGLPAAALLRRGVPLEKQGVIYAEWGDVWVRYDDLDVQVEYSPAPRLLSVTDVGNDQGRLWTSEYDGLAVPTSPTTSIVLGLRGQRSATTSIRVVPTLGDSTSAHLELPLDDRHPLVYFQSAPDSGVDDLGRLRASPCRTRPTALSWAPSTAPDFLVICTTRAAKAQELVCETTATSYDDTGTSTYPVDDAGKRRRQTTGAGAVCCTRCRTYPATDVASCRSTARGPTGRVRHRGASSSHAGDTCSTTVARGGGRSTPRAAVGHLTRAEHSHASTLSRGRGVAARSGHPRSSQGSTSRVGGRAVASPSTDPEIHTRPVRMVCALRPKAAMSTIRGTNPGDRRREEARVPHAQQATDEADRIVREQRRQAGDHHRPHAVAARIVADARFGTGTEQAPHRVPADHRAHAVAHRRCGHHRHERDQRAEHLSVHQHGEDHQQPRGDTIRNICAVIRHTISTGPRQPKGSTHRRA